MKLQSIFLIYRSHNAGVEGSSPSLSTNRISHFRLPSGTPRETRCQLTRAHHRRIVARLGGLRVGDLSSVEGRRSLSSKERSRAIRRPRGTRNDRKANDVFTVTHQKLERLVLHATSAIRVVNTCRYPNARSTNLEQNCFWPYERKDRLVMRRPHRVLSGRPCSMMFQLNADHRAIQSCSQPRPAKPPHA
jgi:hypothetical protein